MKSWQRYQERLLERPEAGLVLDYSKVDDPEGFLEQMEVPLQAAYAAMESLEGGAVANPDENRRVGHYWLRSPERAPEGLGEVIRETVRKVEDWAAAVHAGRIQGATGPFENVLVIGIGGSALGPQFVAHALGRGTRDRLRPLFVDNTDPDGIDRIKDHLASVWGRTLCVVISKSGGTPETRNGMLEIAAAYRQAGLDFARHAVAITGEGSQLDRLAVTQGWLERFPMWDWVGGRTSETSAVGLLPAALQGIDVQAFLQGARDCDAVTRVPVTRRNPAAIMAAMWYHLTDGRGSRAMVVLPYKDRLELFSRYLQQLVMESLGKELDVDGRPVHQGISVYGNKGSTDQHAYVQQLREGVPNFFAVFVEVLKDREGASPEVDPGVTTGDYLHGFLLGTRAALYEKGRQSLTVTLPDVTPYHVGSLIALFERAVGLYASLVRINAYHQPGVEAGKKAAAAVLDLQRRAVEALSKAKGRPMTAEEVAATMGAMESVETVFSLLRHLAANPGPVVEAGGEGTGRRFMIAGT